jgi:hypothetical protein
MNPPANIKYPQAFCGTYVRVHWEFENSLKDILDHSGLVNNFWQQYRHRLKYLDETRRDCIRRRAWFEKLKHEKNLYSMKFQGTKNVRIIFAFVAYEGYEYAILLYPFEEKDRTKEGRNSYGTAIPIAQKRLQEVIKR